MILVTANLPRQILLLTFIGHVRASELAASQQELETFLSQLSPGFTLITDLTSLDLLERDSLDQIARSMDLCNQRGVGLIVRIIPDPLKDIGFSILSVFHYPNRPRMATCKNMQEAASALGL
jgi:hypothetical protein